MASTQDRSATAGAAKVTIDGRPVALFGFVSTANAAVEPPTEFDWVVSFGVESPVVTWELEPALADYVLGQKEVTIKAVCPGAPDFEVKRVVVIGQTGGVNQRRVSVQFGDIRRYLKYTNPIAALNVRAATGNNSLNGFDGTGKFIQAIAAFAYRLYSVKSDGSPVTPSDVVRTIMNLASQSSQDWVLDAPPRSTLIPNDLLLFERGDVAVARMLGTIGGIDLYVDPRDGKMHVKNRVMGDEKRTIEALLTGKNDEEGWGKIVWRDERHNRPASFDIIYDPEAEFRSNYFEIGSSGTQSRGNEDAPDAENVFKVMEYRPGNYLATTPSGKRQCLPGEWLEKSQYLATMPNGPLVPSLPLSLLQAGFNNTNLIYGILGDGQIPDPGEQARINSALQCYRTVFRINRRWSSRCRPGSIQAVMASVSDAETGRRKPSDVYVDYCAIPTLEVALGNYTNPLAAWNNDSFPPIGTTANNAEKAYTDSNGSTPNPLTDMKTAPFGVQMIDSSAGTFRIYPRPDFLDERQDIVPCRVLDIPTLDYTAANNALGLFFWDQSPVAAGHRMTVILSAIPGVGEYHVPVTISAAATRLGVSANAGIGPVMAVRISQNIVTARFPWDDTKSDLIYLVFAGTLSGSEKDPLKTLVPANLSDLTDYATGYCAAVLAAYLDHYEGLQVVPLSPTTMPTGSLHTIVHRITGPRGSYTSTLNCTQTRDPFIADHFLSAGTLANITGRVTT